MVSGRIENPQLIRSDLIMNNDRYAEESKYMSHLKSGGGLFGYSKVSLQQEKADILKLTGNQQIQSHQDLMRRLADDGVYVDDPEVRQKFTDINVQKLEERLLRKGNSQFFKMNGELKLDNDLLADELTRPADLAFEQTVAFQRKETNSILADRLNAFKKRYFRLDIIVGKV